MSTILDALRKVEREREPGADAALEGATVSPEARRRRPFPLVAVAICAVIGFSAGALLSWWNPGKAPVEVASLPAPPPPAIDVPRVPAGAQAKAPAAKSAEVAESEAGAMKGDVAASIPVVAASPVDSARHAAATAPSPAAAVPAPDGEPKAPTEGSETVVAAIEQGSALEPSPFAPVRGTGREGAGTAAKKPSEPPAPAVKAAEPDLDELAAVAPPAAQAPPAADAEAELEPSAEPEPEASPETIFDTGRSPPGAPKVALSFLQWSSDPARRFAFVSIDGAPSQRVHEGEVASGLTVAAITPTGVQFKREGTIFVIRPRH